MIFKNGINASEKKYSFIRYIPGPRDKENPKGLLDDLCSREEQRITYGHIVFITKEDIEFLYYTDGKNIKYLYEKIIYHYPEGEVKIVSEQDADDYIYALENYKKKAHLSNSKTDAYSLDVSKIMPINYFTVQSELMENEYFASVYSFKPCPIEMWKVTLDKFESKVRFKPADFFDKQIVKKKSALSNVNVLMNFLGLFIGPTDKNIKKRNDDIKREAYNDDRSDDSLNKRFENILRSNITLFSNTKEDYKNNILLENALSSYRTFDSDNTLKKAYYTSKKNPLDVDYKCHMRLSTKEQGALLKINRESFNYTSVKHTSYLEVLLPSSFEESKGKIFQGYSHYRGNTQFVYKPIDDSIYGIITWIAGRQSTGKTTLLRNLTFFLYQNGEGTLHVDVEQDKLYTKGIVQMMDYIKGKYVLVDMSLNGMEVSKNNPNALVIKKNIFSYDEEKPEYLSSIQETMYWIREDAERKYNFLRSIILGLSDFSIHERNIITSILIILKLVYNTTSLNKLCSILTDKVARENLIKEVEENRNTLYFDYFIDVNPSEDNSNIDYKPFFNELSILRNIDSSKLGKNIDLLMNQLKKPNYRYFLEDSSENNLDFRKFIKEGIPVFVVCPENASSNERDAISMYFYNKLFYASSYYMTSKAIPYTVLIDEINRFAAMGEFLHQELLTLRRHKLTPYVTMNNLNVLKGTAFEGDFASSNFNAYLMSNCKEEVFDQVSSRFSAEFDYHRDMNALAKLSDNGLKYALYTGVCPGGSKTYSCILELPKDLSIKENLDNYLEEQKLKKKLNKETTKSTVSKVANNIAMELYLNPKKSLIKTISSKLNKK